MTSGHSTSPPHAKVRAAHLYEHGWIRPDDDPARARVQQPWHCAYVEAARLLVGLARVVAPRDLIQDDLLRCVERGAVALIGRQEAILVLWDRTEDGLALRETMATSASDRDAVYSRMVARRASTSSMMCSGTVSRRFPVRAPRSRARGWSQRITPLVRVPAPSRDTVKPRRRAKLPPVVMGRTTGVSVSVLNAAGDTISTGRVPCCSWPAVGSRLTSQMSPRFTTTARCRPACHQSSHDPRRKWSRSSSHCASSSSSE